MAQEWVKQGWAAKWGGRLAVLPGDGQGDPAPPDFFGLQKSTKDVFVGVQGVNSIVRGVLEQAERSGRCEVLAGVRVASIDKAPGDRWQLKGPEPGSQASFHDTAEKHATSAKHDVLADGKSFDAVVVTDISASFDSWHRASAGVPSSLAAQVRDRVRVPLFTALVAFARPGLGAALPLDGITVHGDSALWFACRSASKPGLDSPEHTAHGECWTLVSTPAFAAAEIQRVPMRDPVTGAFIPQDPSYLASGPSTVLLDAFRAACHRHASTTPPPRLHHASVPALDSSFRWPEVVYLGGQRWGSALPAPVSVGGRDRNGRGNTTVEVAGTAYERAGNPPVWEEGRVEVGAGGGEVAVAEAERMVYAGDFVSSRNPGFEAAALSGLAAAEKVLEWVNTGKTA